MRTTVNEHISKSRIDSLLRCQFAYLLHYGYGLTRPPAWIMAFGSSFEAGPNLNWRQKIDSHENIPLHDVVEASVADWHQRCEEVEPIWSPGIDEEIITDHMAAAAENFQLEIGDDIQPSAVQRHIEVRYDTPEGETDWFLDCFIDVEEKAEGRTLIHDVKTTGAAGGLKDAAAAEKWDPVIYTHAVESLGEKVAGFDFLVSRYKNGKNFLKRKQVQIKPIEVSRAELDRAPHVINKFRLLGNHILETGLATPNYSWACKSCGFRAECESEHGRTPPS